LTERKGDTCEVVNVVPHDCFISNTVALWWDLDWTEPSST
jgi:hypothetical protein